MLSFLLFACGEDQIKASTEPSNEGEILVDNDGDGFLSDEDCDDSDPQINPGMEELCDGFDNNCNNLADEEVTETFFVDSDGDGFGNPNISTESCETPSGYTTNGNDCDDTRSETYPGATELCDGLDNDCNNETDEGIGQFFYLDADEDGFGDDANEVEACDLSIGLSSVGGDCDDNNSGRNPSAIELCDEIDNDCDGQTDEDVALTFYVDEDEDGFGNPESTIEACSLPVGYVDNDEDCDDTDTLINPLVDEYCDTVDNDCDGTIDEDLSVDAIVYFADEDEDGFGDPLNTTFACSLPVGYVVNSEDCNDNNELVAPNATEFCNGVDDDCDNEIDGIGSETPLTFYSDNDGDGFGNSDFSVSACTTPSGYVDNDGDCDDNNNRINPDKDEVCDEIDNNCDDTIDEDAIDILSYYLDEDGDGYGTNSSLTVGCSIPQGYVAESGDCDDSNPIVHQGMVELCDTIDNDCDDDIDEDAEGLINLYDDTDGDGFGDDTTLTQGCSPLEGQVLQGDDCDDTEALMNPAMIEICDALNNDCDDETDEDAINTSTFYKDHDVDTFGDPNISIESCFATTGYVSDDTDCNDDNEFVHPNAIEECDEIDNNCDDVIDESTASDATVWYRDGDDDSFGDIDETLNACTQPIGYVDNSDDCEPENGDIHPDEEEVCDGIDNNCIDGIDENTSGSGEEESCYAESCAAALAFNPDAQDGVYYIEGNNGEIVEAYCEMDFEGGGWLAVYNMMERPQNNSEAALFHNSITNNENMSNPVLPESTSLAIYTSNIDLTQYTTALYGWAPSSSSNVTRWGVYTEDNLVGENYVDGYSGAGVELGTFTIQPTGNIRTIYTGDSPSYPHVGMGFSGQIIVWGYDNNSSGYSHWANWYDNNPCCNAGNTSDMTTSNWRYVIYIK